MAEAKERGRDAARPGDIPRSGWRDVALRVKEGLSADHVAIVAAGVAFYGLLALFPAITALISIAGLILEPGTVSAQLEQLAGVLPQDAAAIVQDQARVVASGAGGAAGVAAVLGLALALYSAGAGMKALMEGMNVANGEVETRGLIMLNLVALTLTILLIVGIILAFAAVIVAPALLGALGLPDWLRVIVNLGRWVLLAVLTVLGLALVYRYAPSRARAKMRWITPGAVLATVLWVVASVAFSIYVNNFGSYNATYGALAGVIILLMWLWISAFIVLVGAELNVEMEHQTQRDTTTGAWAPEGARGAVKADTTGRVP